MKNEEIKRFYHPELDGLRFFAFLLVFIHNAEPILSETPLRIISKYGWIGVDLFFCLSAFLITKLLLAEQNTTNTINAKNYYARRAIKIFPQYFLYIFIIFLFKDHIPSGNTNIGVNIFGLITFSYNFVYFYLFPSANLLFIHLWSISYEFQNYMIFPLLAKKLKGNTLKQAAGILGALFLAGNILRAIFIYFQLEHPSIYFLPITHFDSVLGGVAVGAGIFDNLIRKLAGWKLFVLGIIFNAAIFLLPNNDVSGWNLMLTYPLSGIGMSLMIISATQKEIFLFSGLLKNRLIVYLGKISYGLYLFHVGVFFITSQMLFKYFGYTGQELSENYLVVLTISFAITFSIASISHFILEKPFLNIKYKQPLM